MSHLLRTVIEATLNINDDLEKEEAEIQKQKAILAAREEVIQMKKQQMLQYNQEQILDAERVLYLKNHPEVSKHFSNGGISPSGYEMLRRELKMSSTKQVKEYLAKQDVG